MCDEKTLREIFDHFDADKSGSIDAKELKAVLKAYFEAVNEPSDDKRVDEAATVSQFSVS
jgi:Ca2+-binding EF-hand superfamily protein